MAAAWVFACLILGQVGASTLAAAAPAGDEAAVLRWSETAAAHRKSGQIRPWAEALARRAEAYQRLGHRPQALADLEEAAGLVRDDVPSALRAAIFGALGQAYFRAGRHLDAERTLDAALTSAEVSGTPAVSAAVLNDRGTLMAAFGRRAEAEQAFTASLAYAIKGADRMAEGKALLNTARLQRSHGDYHRARDSATAAATAFVQLADSAEKALDLTATGALLGELAASTKEPRLAAQARETLTRAAEIALRAASVRAQAEAWGQLAELEASQQRLLQALALNDRALFLAQSINSPDTLFFAQWRAARLLQQSERSDEALPAYRRALASLARIKTDLASDLWARQESFTQRIGPAYLGMADLLLQRAAAQSDAGTKRETLREIQQTLESFRQVELEDYFRDDCVARYLARARGIEQISARTAVVYPVPLSNRLELVVTIGDAIHQITVPVGLDELEGEARSLRALLEKRTTYQYLPHARRLYDWIIRPLQPLLEAARVDTIVMIPDRPLRAIPLAALHDGREFLIARYAVATAPSLTLVDPTPLRQEKFTVLASGLTESVQGFAALPHVGVELEALGRLRTGATLLDRTFTTANLEHELRSRPYSIIHLASHAQFEADSRRSFLLTYDGRLTIDRLEDHMKLNRFRDEPVELLFLSACQTAAGDERAALGLAGVAVKAGARSALATLWHINDQASSLLVAEFYRQISQAGVSKAEALRRAQVSLFNDLRYRHPGYWSPFLLIGNWL